jgi:IS30 family transposase
MKTKILVVRPYFNKYKHLNQDQRIYIANRIKQWASLRQIARELSISHSTISRELKRNSIYKWRWIVIYDPFEAQKNYFERRIVASAKRRLFNKYPHIFKTIENLLIKYKRSPIQISWRLNLELNISISPPTIYRRIRIYRPDLQIYLRHKRHPPKNDLNIVIGLKLNEVTFIEEHLEII